MRQPRTDRPPWTAIGVVVAVVLAAAVLAVLSVYAVDPGERAVVLRAGRLHDEVGPGLHLRVPFLERTHAVAVERVRLLETGATALTPDKQPVRYQAKVGWRACDAARFYLTTRARADQFEARATQLVRATLRDFTAREHWLRDAASIEVTEARLREALGGPLADMGGCIVSVGLSPG